MTSFHDAVIIPSGGVVLDRQRVVFRSDGYRLVGELYIPRGVGPWPGIVLCHGLASRKERHADFASYASRQGFVVLAYDARGHGESEGQLDGKMLNDVEAAVTFLRGHEAVDPSRVAVRGSSLGGNLALHYAALDRGIRAVAAICPAPEEILLEGLQQAIVEGIAPSTPDVRLEPLSLRARLREQDIRQAAKQITPRPLLLIHCQGDEVVPVAVSESLFTLAGEPKELWLLPAGTHTTAQHDQTVHQFTVDWLKRKLAAPIP